MWTFDTMQEAETWLRFLNKHARLLVLGLDNAGKSTLLYRLKRNFEGTLRTGRSTNPTSQKLKIGNVHFTAFDISTHQEAERPWEYYFLEVDAIVFIVDAKDPERFAEAREELRLLLLTEELWGVAVLILGNKTDHPNGISCTELKIELGLEWIRHRPIGLFMCSVVEGKGYGQGFQWLTQFLPNNDQRCIELSRGV
ncbi:ADP-ribosylation factor family protein [Jackrogersella minutella]|nr:ADP-ribosylation factor family protein [Jackrogersella minutella]